MVARTPGELGRLAHGRGRINIKLMNSGVDDALKIAAVAREAELTLRIGGNLESILGMTMSAAFAAGLGGFRFADLDTPMFLASNPFEGGYNLEGGIIPSHREASPSESMHSMPRTE